MEEITSSGHDGEESDVDIVLLDCYLWAVPFSCESCYLSNLCQGNLYMLVSLQFSLK